MTTVAIQDFSSSSGVATGSSLLFKSWVASSNGNGGASSAIRSSSTGSLGSRIDILLGSCCGLNHSYSIQSSEYEAYRQIQRCLKEDRRLSNELGLNGKPFHFRSHETSRQSLKS